MFAPTATRVNRHTSDKDNAKIRGTTRNNLAYYASNTSEIPARLRQLDAEWDVERALATGSTTLTLTGVGLGFFVHPYFLALSAVVQLFYLQHALQGWCPPLPVFRKLGFRTEKEIQEERHHLSTMLRGSEA